MSKSQTHTKVKVKSGLPKEGLDISPDTPRFGQLMQFVRESVGGDLTRNGSIVKQLWKKWGARDTNAAVRGAALLGWHDLRSLNSRDGLGRRWATAAYWQHHNRRQGWEPPEELRHIFARLGNA